MSHTIERDATTNGWYIINPNDVSTTLPCREINDNFLALSKLFSSTEFISGKIPVGNCVFVTTDVTDTGNASNLQNAYDIAAGLTHTSTERAWVIIPPGRYDFGSGYLLLNAECVDLIGFDKNITVITSVNGTSNQGTLMQTADDVAIMNLTIENMLASGGGVHNNSANPCAYCPAN